MDREMYIGHSSRERLAFGHKSQWSIKVIINGALKILHLHFGCVLFSPPCPSSNLIDIATVLHLHKS